MKNIYLTGGIFLASLLAPVSCNYLDKMPDDELTIDMVFSDNVRIEDWLAGVYSSIPDPYTGFFRAIGYDVLSGELTPNSGLESFGWAVALNIRDGNLSPSTDWPPHYWTELPKRIREGYIFLDKAKPIPPKLPSTTINRMKAEVRFLIAYYYWLLLEIYGPIPFNPGPGFVYSDFNNVDAMMYPQAPYDDIVNWIDAELTDLARSGTLPAVYTGVTDFGRATSIMCLAVRARMLMFAASDLVNGNPDYANHVNSEGTPLFNSTYDPSKWVRAKDACKELIDAAEAANYSLYIEKNSDGSIDPFLSYQSLMFKRWDEGNREILFARPQYGESSSVSDYEKCAAPHGLGKFGGNIGVTQELVDDFFMEDGRTTGKGYRDNLIGTPSPDYSESGFTNDVEKRNTQWNYVQRTPDGKETGLVALDKTYKMYAKREPRFYISVLFNGGWIKMAPKGLRRANFLLNTKDEWSDAIDNNGTHDAPENGYLVRKKVHPDMSADDAGGSTHPYRPQILFRLAEAYLSYAEALVESGGDQTEALKYVNKVRERAGVAPYGSSYVDINGNVLPGLPVPGNLREAIRRERRVELNCEGIYFGDLRRWKIAEERLSGQLYGMNAKTGTKYTDDSGDPAAFFKRTPYLDAPRIFGKKNYWFPVPQSAMEKNPKLVQNPFWNE
jgi:hypothetical protein